MGSIFQANTSIAIYVNSEKMQNKIKALFSNIEEEYSIEYFLDELEFKNHIENANVNVAFCDIDTKDNKFSDKLIRDLILLKRGTYFIVITSDKHLMNLTTLYRIGTNGLLFKQDHISEYKKELDRAVEHIKCWRIRLEQVLADRSMERELDDLLK
jgi:DNA-binding NtrC family response regulator